MRWQGAEGLRSRHRRLRCGETETGSEIPARLQQPRRGLASTRAIAAGAAGLRRGGAPQSVRQERGRNYEDLAKEIERLGALAYQKNLPSFNCATAKRQVEKAICADPGLAQLDRNINDVFLRVIADAEFDSHRAALALTRQQRDFVDQRNASFGRRGYDLRQAMEERLDKLNDDRPAVGFTQTSAAVPA